MPTHGAVAPTVWGLSADDLHRAYWRSAGIECVRPGQEMPVDNHAIAYFLLDEQRMALFDLETIRPRLLANRDGVVHVRVHDVQNAGYRERVILDDNGVVERIERRYRPALRTNTRIMVTTDVNLARRWAESISRSHARRALRQYVSATRVDRLGCDGACFRRDVDEDERRLIMHLVRTWPRPDQAIDGLSQIGGGIWTMDRAEPDEEATLIGPLWIGTGRIEPSDCLVGPDWRADVYVKSAARLRPIRGATRRGAGRSSMRPGSRRWAYAFVKRTFDVVVSLAALIALAPVFLIAAIAIAIEDGRPVFYGHLRQSRGGRLFKCWKFRSMRRNAEALVPTLVDDNMCDGPQVAIQNDPRVTRVGRFLRRAQLDELPQFLNVLRGEMSIVGPRPSPDRENQYCPAWREARLSVRPGITGLWQVRRTRAPGVDFQEWIRYDMEYVERASFWLDLKICVLTAWIVVTGGVK